MIVKYKEMDLLQHPVIERLLHMKTKLYARSYLLLYLFLNTVYVLLWCTLSILMSAVHEPFHWSKENAWKVALALLVLLLTLASAIEVILKLFDCLTGNAQTHFNFVHFLYHFIH